MDKKEKLINYLIIILFVLAITFKIINNNIFNIYSNIICFVTIIVVIIRSVYFTMKLKLLQFNIVKIYKTLSLATKDDLRALFMSMGSKIGVGSIAGISLAIYLGGAGVLFWIWIITILSSILTYCETYLGSIYKISNNSGPYYYIKSGLKNRNLSIIYALILIFTYSIGFIGIQSNTIIKSLNATTNINNKFLIILVLLLVISIIFNKINKVVSIMSKIVPLMCLLYLLFGIIIIFKINNLGDIIILIMKDGLNIDKSLIYIIILGLKRGIFATESGLGTSSISSSISNNKEKQSIYQLLGVQFISLVVITITGIIVISAIDSYQGYINGVEIVMDTFNRYYGVYGYLILDIIIILFAVSTIISSYFFTLKGLEFIKDRLTNKDYLFTKILIIVMTFLGMVINSTIIWSMIDIFIMVLLLINIYSLIKLRGEINI